MKPFFEARRPMLTFEIFPPKGEGDLDSIFATVDALACLSPDLISVTYGAGGTSRENTVEIAAAIQNSYNIPALAHLTCVGCSRGELDRTLGRLAEKGVENILALRGDLNEGDVLTDFRYASNLVRYIREHSQFNVFAACYPEKHLEVPSMDEDIRRLKNKADLGVDVLISQLFFDNDHFYDFLGKARAAGISTPVVAGIMPVTSASQIGRMVSMCGATVPESVQKIIRTYGHNSMAMKEAGIAYAVNQIVDLLASGVDGIHLYTINQPDIAKRIAESIRGVLYSLRVKRG